MIILEGVRKYSCLLFYFPKELQDRLNDFKKTITKAEKNIEQEEDCDAAHVTLKYGLTTDCVDDIQPVIKGWGPIKIKIGGLSSFPFNGEYEVLKADIISSDIKKLNKHVCSKLEHEDKFPKYIPHMTVCYMQRGCASRYLDLKLFRGIEIEFNQVTFSSSLGYKWKLSLN